MPLINSIKKNRTVEIWVLLKILIINWSIQFVSRLAEEEKKMMNLNTYLVYSKVIGLNNMLSH